MCGELGSYFNAKSLWRVSCAALHHDDYNVFSLCFVIFGRENSVTFITRLPFPMESRHALVNNGLPKFGDTVFDVVDALFFSVRVMPSDT